MKTATDALIDYILTLTDEQTAKVLDRLDLLQQLVRATA